MKALHAPALSLRRRLPTFACALLVLAPGAIPAQGETAALPRYHEFVMAGAHLGAAPEWIRGVNQTGGAFLEQPSRWEVATDAASGVGALVVELDRSKLASDMAVTLLLEDDARSDYVIQLLDEENRVVLVDLTGSTAPEQRRGEAATFAVPLSRHPSATRIAVRRVSGPLKLYGVVLFPLTLPREGTGDVIDEIDLLTLLKAPLSTNSPTWEAVQDVLREKSAAAARPGAAMVRAADAGAPASFAAEPRREARGATWNDRVVVLEAHVGKPWPGVRQLLESLGADVRLVERPLDAADLAEAGVLVLSGIACASCTNQFTAAQAAMVGDFVQNGGGLLCAGQVWSWVYPEYGNRPADEHPYNLLGERLGFRVTGFNVGAPAYLSPELLGALTEVVHTDWWPSKIDLLAPSAVPLIRDDRLYAIAAKLEYGRGRAVIVGHDGLLRDNPGVALALLSHLVQDPPAD